jgi:hypothetical protein
MNIGIPIRELVIEPIEEPVPDPVPAERPLKERVDDPDTGQS